MIPTSIEDIEKALACPCRGRSTSFNVRRVAIHSRDVSPGTIFVALKGESRDGHSFLAEAFKNGATAAIVAQDAVAEMPIDPAWPLLVVKSPLQSLQDLASAYRKRVYRRTIAITGSNGKTIVKDALGALLRGRSIMTSPGSYNSQIGLPLAILSADAPVDLGILEVGVSEPGEMKTLESIAAPHYGILTNIGMAHYAAFGSRMAIAAEKMQLFRNLPPEGWLILPHGEPLVANPAARPKCRIEFAGSEEQQLSLEPLTFTEQGQLLKLSERGKTSGRSVLVRTRSPEIIENLQIAATAAFMLGVSVDEIGDGLANYQPASTRLEIWLSNDNIRVINDTHSADPISVRAALRTAALNAPPSGRKIFAFSGMRDLGEQAEPQHHQVGLLAAENRYDHLFLVGNGYLKSTAASYNAQLPDGKITWVETPESLKGQLVPLLHPGDTILFKGPRNGGMDDAAKDIWSYIAQRCLWVDLSAIKENVATFQRHCGDRVAILAMLKALAYGTDLVELSSWIGRLGIQHIGVSSTSEGIAARKAGVVQKIYVFLPHEDDVDNLVRFDLTPIVYSEELLESYARKLRGRSSPLSIHLKVDTGMHRLGVEPSIIPKVVQQMRDSKVLQLTGLCTHFAAADESQHDDFTREQIDTFMNVISVARDGGFDDLQVHAANTAATIRFPEAHFNMVRIGLGLYGIFPCQDFKSSIELRLAIGVTSRIAGLKEFPSGASVGYSRSYRVNCRILGGIVPFGYDDGLPRSLGSEGHVLVEGEPAPILGRISMDQIMIDVSHISGVTVGSEVLLYGTHGGHTLRPEIVAASAQTIPHELLIRLGRRVHRIFTEP